MAEIVPIIAGSIAILTAALGLVRFGWKKWAERKALKAQRRQEIVPGERAYPVRATCREETEFHPGSGYHDGLWFEIFNQSDHPVTVKAFGLDLTLQQQDEWHQQELARLDQGRQFPVRLDPHDGVEGGVSLTILYEDETVPWDYVAAKDAFVEVVGFGRQVLEVQKGK